MKMWSKPSRNKKTCKPFLAIICVLLILRAASWQLPSVRSTQWQVPAWLASQPQARGEGSQ
jgi:hypothetical protein